VDEDAGAILVRANKSSLGLGMEFTDATGTFKGSVHMTGELYRFFCVLGHPQYIYLEVFSEEGGISLVAPFFTDGRLQKLLEEEFLDAIQTV